MFQTNIKSQIIIQKMITWDKIRLHDNWDLADDIPPVPLEHKELEEIVERANGSVFIRFQPRHSISYPPSCYSEKSFKHTRSHSNVESRIPSEPVQRVFIANPTGITVPVYPSAGYNPTPSDMGDEIYDINVIEFKEDFSISKEYLRKDFNSIQNKDLKKASYNLYNFQFRDYIRTEYYKNLIEIRENIPFFSWFTHTLNGKNELCVLS